MNNSRFYKLLVIGLAQMFKHNLNSSNLEGPFVRLTVKITTC